MITSLDVKQNKDETTHIKYTASFEGTNHICYGEFDANKEEATTAFSGMSASDMWAGFKKLIFTRLNKEAENSLSEKDNTNEQ